MWFSQRYLILSLIVSRLLVHLRFNIDNKFGHHALRATLRSITGEERPLVPLPTSVNPDSSSSSSAGLINSGASFVELARNGLTGVGIVLKDNPNVASWRFDERTDISKFLNRLLGECGVRGRDKVRREAMGEGMYGVNLSDVCLGRCTYSLFKI